MPYFMFPNFNKSRLRKGLYAFLIYSITHFVCGHVLAGKSNSEGVLPAILYLLLDTPPSQALVIEYISEDTGLNKNDHSTNDTTLIFTGTGEPGYWLNVLLNEELIGKTKSGQDGRWELDHSTASLEAGDYTITALYNAYPGSPAALPVSIKLNEEIVYSDILKTNRPYISPDRIGTHSFYIRLKEYLDNGGVLDLHSVLNGHSLTSSDQVNVLQMDSGLPTGSSYGGITGGKESGDSHANNIASILYDCQVSDGTYTYTEGCNINAKKYARDTSSFRNDLNPYFPSSGVVNVPSLAQLSDALFGGAVPSVMTMSVANPSGYGAQGLRSGDYLFSEFNILAVSSQPGSYTQSNGTLSGNYYNSIVVGNPRAGLNYNAQTSVDNHGGSRNKPDMVAFSSILASASSWAVPEVSGDASALLALSKDNDSILGEASYMEAMKAIIMAGAHKQNLQIPELQANDSYIYIPYEWTNSSTKPLDSYFGVGVHSPYNSYQILVAGQQRATEQRSLKDIGWDTQVMNSSADPISYSIVTEDSEKDFSLVLCWNRKVIINDDGSTSSILPDFLVEIFKNTRLIATSDDAHNNVEHIYLKEGLAPNSHFEIKVTRKDNSDQNVRYGMAWGNSSKGIPYQ